MQKSLLCYTIGHSKHSPEHFAELIKAHGVNLVIDVRAVPYSRHAPQFNFTAVQKSLCSFGLDYKFLGEFLGGKMDITSDDFKIGLDNIIADLNNGAVPVLMCAEKDPLKCHRFLKIAPELNKREVRVVHLLADGSEYVFRQLELC
ncbi:MAG: DUF488 domain-containing protein [Oscillospiraceae bacterium]|nr:DUF488 domain-containing protein [Oscillospiraceae bacterium]